MGSCYSCIAVRGFCFSRLPITRTLANSNLALTSDQSRSLYFLHKFTVILPLVTRTLDNLNLPLTRSIFLFPFRLFLYNFTLYDSNHVCGAWLVGKKVRNTEFISKLPGQFFVATFFVTPIQIQCPSPWSVHDTCIPSPSIFLFSYTVRLFASNFR